MTGIATAELAMQRNLTLGFIYADATDVVLYRSTRTSDGAGGVLLGDPAPLPAQTMRIIPLQDGAPGGQNRFTADGQAVRPGYMIMGKYDADMERWDTYETADGRFEVVFVNANRQYQVKGEVYFHGR